MIGKTIGRYEIVRALGKGGFATVYRGYAAALERHPNIIIGYELGEEARSAYIVMEFVQDDTLKARRLAPATQEIAETLAEARRSRADSGARTRQRPRLERQCIRDTMLMYEKRWEEAEQDFGQALEVDPAFRDAAALRDCCHEQRGQLAPPRSALRHRTHAGARHRGVSGRRLDQRGDDPRAPRHQQPRQCRPGQAVGAGARDSSHRRPQR